MQQNEVFKKSPVWSFDNMLLSLHLEVNYHDLSTVKHSLLTFQLHFES